MTDREVSTQRKWHTLMPSASVCSLSSVNFYVTAQNFTSSIRGTDLKKKEKKTNNHQKKNE